MRGSWASRGSLVAGVWLGNDDGALTKRVTGGNLPTEVWHNFMKLALKDQKPVAASRQRTLPAGPAKCRWPMPAASSRRRRARAPGSRRSSPGARAQKNFFEKLFGL